MTKMNDPGKRIESVWLFVAVDEDGDEGLPAFNSGPMMIPMVASDERRRDLCIEKAREVVGTIPGHRIEIRKFTGDYVVEGTIVPSRYDEMFSAAEPGCAPGGVLVRIVADDCTVLAEDVLRGDLSDEAINAIADRQGDETRKRSEAGQVVRMHAYDGDTGACMATVVVRP